MMAKGVTRVPDHEVVVATCRCCEQQFHVALPIKEPWWCRDCGHWFAMHPEERREFMGVWRDEGR